MLDIWSTQMSFEEAQMVTGSFFCPLDDHSLCNIAHHGKGNLKGLLHIGEVASATFTLST